MGISQESHSGRRKRYQPEQELVSRKEILHSSKEAKEWWVNGGWDHCLT